MITSRHVHGAYGDVVAALTTLRETQLEHRTGLGYTDAVAAEARLLEVSGRTARPLTAEQYRTLVRRLRGYSRYTEAAALIEAWRAVAAAEAELAVATFAGRRRPPTLIGRSLWGQLPEVGDQGARGLLDERPDLVVEVPCSGDPYDVDTMEDLRRWT